MKGKPSAFFFFLIVFSSLAFSYDSNFNVFYTSFHIGPAGFEGPSAIDGYSVEYSIVLPPIGSNDGELNTDLGPCYGQTCPFVSAAATATPSPTPSATPTATPTATPSPTVTPPGGGKSCIAFLEPDSGSSSTYVAVTLSFSGVPEEDSVEADCGYNGEITTQFSPDPTGLEFEGVCFYQGSPPFTSTVISSGVVNGEFVECFARSPPAQPNSYPVFRAREDILPPDDGGGGGAVCGNGVREFGETCDLNDGCVLSQVCVACSACVDSSRVGSVLRIEAGKVFSGSSAEDFSENAKVIILLNDPKTGLALTSDPGLNVKVFDDGSDEEIPVSVSYTGKPGVFEATLSLSNAEFEKKTLRVEAWVEVDGVEYADVEDKALLLVTERKALPETDLIAVLALVFTALLYLRLSKTKAERKRK